MKIKLLIIFVLLSFICHSQTHIDTLIKQQEDSIKFDNIDKTLRMYGKDQTIANKISIVSVVSVVIGTIVGVPATPLLLITSVCDLTTILVSGKANKKLAKNGSR